MRARVCDARAQNGRVCGHSAGMTGACAGMCARGCEHVRECARACAGMCANVRECVRVCAYMTRACAQVCASVTRAYQVDTKPPSKDINFLHSLAYVCAFVSILSRVV